MKKNESVREDELRPEYDLSALRVRGVGPARRQFSGMVRLAPDVAELYPSAEAVNEALRFLARITRENQASPHQTNT